MTGMDLAFKHHSAAVRGVDSGGGNDGGQGGTPGQRWWEPGTAW